MANTTQLAFVAVAVMLLQASLCAVTRHPAETRGDGYLAVMSETSFEERDGGGPAACDGRYHNNRDQIVALSTQWYAGGSLWQNSITIRSEANGRTVGAVVVDECDSRSGCPDNMIATSKAIWDALGLDANNGQDSVFWSIEYA